MIECVVYDMDGTLILLDGFSDIMHLRVIEYAKKAGYRSDEETREIIETGKRYAIENIGEYAWTDHGNVVMLCEDSFALWRSVIGYINTHAKETVEDYASVFLNLYNMISSWDYRLTPMTRETIIKLNGRGIRQFIITNSKKPDKIDFVNSETGLDIPAYVDAQKWVVTPDGISYTIAGRTVYANRPRYREKLEQIMKDHNLRPEEMLVIGDTTMDVLQPHTLGMRCLLKRNETSDGFRTPDEIVRFMMTLGIPVINNLEEIENHLN